MAPPPYSQQVQAHRAVLATAPPHRSWNQNAVAHLLVQGDVVDADDLFSGEDVGAVVAVLQHRPAVRRARTRATRVARTPESEQAAGRSQTLRAGVVVIQKAWRGGGERSTNRG